MAQERVKPLELELLCEKLNHDFSGKITGGFQMGLTALNVISILLGLGLSISVVKNPKRRDVF